MDCFFAENADDPMCIRTGLTASPLRTTPEIDQRDGDSASVDCFYAENRDDPLCRPMPVTAQAPLR